jgi:hypothetical protein
LGSVPHFSHSGPKAEQGKTYCNPEDLGRVVETTPTTTTTTTTIITEENKQEEQQ